MTRFEQRGGIKKEIVDDYRPTGAGVTIPTAPNDTLGGRPDLEGNTVLEPPLDDPPMTGDLPPSRIRGSVPPVSSRNSGNLAKSPINKENDRKIRTGPAMPPPPPPPSDDDYTVTPRRINNTHAVAEQALATEGVAVQQHVQTGQHEQEVQEKMTAAPQDRISELLDALEEVAASPEVAAAVKSRVEQKASAQDPMLARPPDPMLAPPPDDDTFVEVVLSGEFGRFRSQVSDVEIFENHIALIYTKQSGDEDLRFEPPMGKPFRLIVPKEGDRPAEFLVEHFGLTTRLRRFDALVVTFPFTDEGTKETAEDDHQD